MADNRNNNYYNEKLIPGDMLFYRNYYKKAAEALLSRTNESLKPYFQFLEQAIKSEEKKGTYEIAFRFIYQIELIPVTKKIIIDKLPDIFKIQYDYDLLKEVENRFIYNAQDKIVKFDKSNCVRDGEYVIVNNLQVFPEENEIIELKGDEIKYEFVKQSSPESSQTIILNTNKIKIKSVEEKNGKFIIEVDFDQKINSVKLNDSDIKDFEVKTYEPNSLFDEETEYIFEKEKDKCICTSLPKSLKLKDENGYFYKWKEASKKEQNNQYNQSYFIQLQDDEDEDEKQAKPISDYFFDDEITDVYQEINSKIKIEIKSRTERDKILELKEKPIENKKIKMVINVHNLFQQKKAIRMLNTMPVLEYHNFLLKVFEDIDRKQIWDNIWNKSISDWFILKDISRNGTQEQRNFVEKAIATKDFAILEGPPGSGKTTAITELILQMIKDKKKILLSASTHVAIDNVLERIKDYPQVVAIRVGDAGRIGESVREFQLDNKKDELRKKFNYQIDEDLLEQLILDSVNLVCGTTMGIQQYPKIKNQNKEIPIYPEFDCLIIDESSKTTFQEFLVPALYAKKWILVGDIKQLSPYIEQTHIIHNLSILLSDFEKIGIKYAFETLYNDKEKKKYVIELTKREIEEYLKWYEYWEEKDKSIKNKKVFEITEDMDVENDDFLFELLSNDIILVNKEIFGKYKKYIPKTYIHLGENRNTSFEYEQSYLHHKKKYIQNNIEIAENFIKEFKEKSWEEKITWRMVRVYEKRMLKDKNNSYEEKTYELLKPVDEIKKKQIERIYYMTFPSILESIQVGNGEKSDYNTTLTKGFPKNSLQQRHEILLYQHRMHSDIAEFSRENFYKDNNKIALQDSNKINRDWRYKRYSKRAVWIDVVNKNSRKDNKNEFEANKLMDELNYFIEWAFQNKNENGEKWVVGVITFYRPQEFLLREKLRNYCNKPRSMSRFEKNGIDILLYTVDKFQGMEADVIFLSMVKNQKIGFLDNINRLNVALTRAKYQRVIFGNKKFFSEQQKGSIYLKKLALESFEEKL